MPADWSFLLIDPASWAAIAIILAQYLAGILHLSEKLAPHIATAAIIVACAICRGRSAIDGDFWRALV
jgi:hypothetical protein